MKFEILLSTMRRDDPSFVEKMNIGTNVLIINQQPSNEHFEKSIYKYGKTRMITYIEKGLSKSRNRAIENAQGTICLMADDDLLYVDNVEKVIMREFERNPEYDILVFQVEGIDKKFKDYPINECKIGYIKSLRVSSVEIAFKVDKIRKSGIRFNELFGTGSKYYSGEENIFLYNCLNKGLKIKYIPIKIANLYIGESTWFKGYDKEYFWAKGAAFAAMSKKWSNFLILQFLIRKYRLYRKKINLLQAARSIVEGKKEYLTTHVVYSKVKG